MKRVGEVLWLFLRLGATGFGGPLALAAQMQRDMVEARSWISEEEFRQVFGLVKSMPGAVAFNTAVYLGRRRAGLLGGCAAAFGLIAPSFLLILVFAMNYDAMKSLSGATRVLDGMQASALALIAAAMIPLAGPLAKKPAFWGLVAIGAALFATDRIPEPILIVGGGLTIVLMRRSKKTMAAIAAAPVSAIALTATAPVAAEGALREMFLICFKAGAFVFGSGLAIVPLLQRDFVERLGWITHAEFMDALAVGQVTPGPVMMTTTFLGYKVAGLPGAFVATIAVFLAGFIHMMTWFPSAVRTLARQAWIEDFIFGALSMVIGTILVTIIVLGEAWRSKPGLYAITVGAFALTRLTKIPSWAIIVLGATAGWIGPSL